MNGKKFILVLACFSVLFIFAKIYQQNKTVRARYALQRLERECELLVKEHNQQNILLSKVANPIILKQKALALGFVPVHAKQLLTLTVTSMV